MTERERLLEKLGKVKALADRGEGGEKESAERTLAALMKRYGITEEDLEDTKATIHWIRYKTDWERRLLGQLAYMHLGAGHSFGCVGRYTKRPRKEVGVECTPAQYIEIEADFAFYSEAMKEEMELFYSAFLQKNGLFPPPELAAEPTEAEKEEWEDMERVWRYHNEFFGNERTTNGADPFQGHFSKQYPPELCGRHAGLAGAGNRLFHGPVLHEVPRGTPRRPACT